MSGVVVSVEVVVAVAVVVAAVVAAVVVSAEVMFPSTQGPGTAARMSHQGSAGQSFQLMLAERVS